VRTPRSDQIGHVNVRVQPRARRTEVAAVRGDVVVIRVAAPPLDGRANEAVCGLVAELAGVPRRRVSVIRGERSRDKLLRVEGVGDVALLAALAPPDRG
jgi:uncharacterized protein (TIGR00251 family)